LQNTGNAGYLVNTYYIKNKTIYYIFKNSELKLIKHEKSKNTF